MSGGSYDYLCWKMDEAARQLQHKGQPAYRIAFGNLMRLCAKAMHDVEWVDSGDMGRGDDKESVMKCISHTDVLKVTVEEAKKIKEELEKLIEMSTDKL